MHLQVGHGLSSSRLGTSHPAFHLRRFTQKTDKPAPRQQNSPNAFERPPFVLHSSNQLSTAHLLLRLRLRGRIPSHLYANYFATWTKVIMLSDRKPTGLKSKAEINKLPPLNAEKTGMRAALWLIDQLYPPFKSSSEAAGGREPRQRSMHQPRVPSETTLLQQNSIRSRALTYPASAPQPLSSARRVRVPGPAARVPLPAAAAQAQPRRRGGGRAGLGPRSAPSPAPRDGLPGGAGRRGGAVFHRIEGKAQTPQPPRRGHREKYSPAAAADGVKW